MKGEISYTFNKEEKTVSCNFTRPSLTVEEIKSNETWIPGKSEWNKCKIIFNEYQDLKDFSTTLHNGLKEIKLKLNKENWILKEVVLIKSEKTPEHKFVIIKYKDVSYLVK